MVELVLAAAGAAVAAAAATRRWLHRRRLTATQREHERFSHYVHPDVEEVRLGVSLEPAGAAPDHEPLVTVEEPFTMRLGPGKRLTIPAGARLQVRAFAGGRRRILDHVTTPRGTLARISFDVPREVSFWILDAPEWAQLREVDGARGLRGTGPWEITTRLRPVARVGGTTHVTMFELRGPPWLWGLDRADEWIRPRAGATEIVVLDLSDPSAASEYEPRDDLVAGVMPYLAAGLWVATGAQVRLLVSYVPGRGRLVNRQRAPWHDDELAELQRGAGALIHGAAEADVVEAGATVTVRLGGAHQDPPITAPLGSLPAAVARVLARRSVATPAAAPGDDGLPRDLEVLARVLGDLVRMSMMAPEVRAIPRRPIGAAAVAAAARMAAAEPACQAARLTWIATAVAAYAIDDLPEAERAAVRAAVLATTGPDDPLHLLAPRVLRDLGFRDEAVAARDARRRDLAADGFRDPDPYARWLDRID